VPASRGPVTRPRLFFSKTMAKQARKPRSCGRGNRQQGKAKAESHPKSAGGIGGHCGPGGGRDEEPPLGHGFCVYHHQAGRPHTPIKCITRQAAPAPHDSMGSDGHHRVETRLPDRRPGWSCGANTVAHETDEIPSARPCADTVACGLVGRPLLGCGVDVPRVWYAAA
jgi:hypothetical protein